MSEPKPVILDSDIGGDIDDTWALALLLKCPELKPVLMVSDTGDTEYRARLIAKLLEVAGRTDVPVGVGVPFPGDGPRQRQLPWVEDYGLADYPGPLHRDGVRAIIDTVMGSVHPVTLIAIGPVSNIRAALEREPRIAPRTHFVGMHGSFAWHPATNLNNREFRAGQIPEFNVKRDIPAAQAVFAAPWRSLTITPVDSCGMIVLDGARYARIRESADPLLRAVLENYRMWSPHNGENDAETHTSVLFDTVAVYLAVTRAHLTMSRMGVRVDDLGFTVEDAKARPVDVALAWENLTAYYDWLEARFLAPTVPGPHGRVRLGA